MLADAKRLRDICDARGDPRLAVECYSGLIDFLIDDIVRGGRQFKSFLNHQGLTGRK